LPNFPEAKRMSEDMLDRADRTHGDVFTSFYFLWMSFNGWMSCVTGLELDSKMIEALGADRRLSAAFLELKKQDKDFGDSVLEFAEWWPIFSSADARKKMGINFIYELRDRADFARQAVDRKIRHRPKDWVSGQEPRWSELIWAIYQVRCNLFHGVKSPHNEGDHALVRLSFRTLMAFVAKANCYAWQNEH
jgi:hypothetical protein